jgi:hypothetical protein
MDQRAVKNVRGSAIGSSSSIGRNRSQLEVGTDFSFGQQTVASGDVAGGLFIVRSGRVEIIDEGVAGKAGQRVARRASRVARRGDILDGLASLREGYRSMSGRARRNVELLGFGV